MGEDFPAPLAWFRQGSVLAGYRLEAQIGAGGMAVVFRARDERLGRSVALKILAPTLAADGAFRRRFIAESRAAALVDDPHIIPVYEAGDADGVLFIAMRFVTGGDLRRVLEREGALPPARAAEFISPVASALDTAHAAGLVHRDVKPANILVDARPNRPDHMYLSDFGVSKGATSSVSLTGTGQYLGTPDYSAPEQIQGRAVDGRTDQYALACVAFELLSGSVPFERDQGMAVLLAHLSEAPPSVSSRRPDLPAAADQVLARALAKVPEKRYESCGDFADALREALGLAPYHPSRPASVPDHPTTAIVSRLEFPEPIADGAGQAVVSADLAADATIDSVPVAGSPGTADLPAAAESIPGPDGGVPPSRPRPKRLLAIALAAAVAAAAAIVTPLLLAGSPGANSPSSVRLIATLTDPGTSKVGFSVAFSPNGATLATAGANHNGSTTYLWNAATGKVTATFTDPGGVGVHAVAFSPDGTTLATGDVDGDTYLWNIATKTLAATITDPGGVSVSSVTFSPDGAILAVGDDNGSTYLWNVAARTLTATFTGRAGPAGGNSVAFGPSGATLATSDGDGNGGTYLWNVAARTLTATLTAAAGTGVSSITSVAFSPSGASLAIGDANGKTYLWNVAAKTLTATLTDPLSVDSVAFSPNGASLAVGDANASTYLWNVAARTLAATLTGTRGTSVSSLAFSPNGASLAVILGGGTADLWAIR